MPFKEGRRHVRIRASRNRPRLPDGQLAPRFKKLCRQCGRPFASNQPEATCCSRKCTNALYYKELHNDTTIPGYTKSKVCPICGTVFTTTRDKRRYCYNKACVRQAKAEKDKERRKKV